MNQSSVVVAFLFAQSFALNVCVLGDEHPVEISERALQIHARGYVWDGHNDLPWAARERNDIRFEKIDLWNEPKLHTDIPRLRAGNVGAQFWSVFVPSKTRQAGTAFQTTMEQIDCVYGMVKKYPDVFEIALNSNDVERIRKAGKIASLMGVEGGHSIENSLGKLKELFSAPASNATANRAILVFGFVAADDGGGGAAGAAASSSVMSSACKSMTCGLMGESGASGVMGEA